MKLGISTACFYGDPEWEVESTLELYNDLGISLAEVFLNCESEYEEGFVRMLAEKKGSVKVHSVHPHGTSFEPELFSVHARTRAEAEKKFRQVCQAGYILGAKYVTFHGPFLKVGRVPPFEEEGDSKESAKIKRDRFFATFGATMNHLCEIAACYGLQIAYENVNWAYGYKPDFFVDLLGYCPALKCTLDVKQAIHSDTDPLKFVEAMGERIVTVHLCDMDRSYKHKLPFEGKYNFTRLFRDLKRRNLDPNVFLEVYRSDFSNVEHIMGCYEKMRDLMESIKQEK